MYVKHVRVLGTPQQSQVCQDRLPQSPSLSRVNMALEAVGIQFVVWGTQIHLCLRSGKFRAWLDVTGQSLGSHRKATSWGCSPDLVDLDGHLWRCPYRIPVPFYLITTTPPLVPLLPNPALTDSCFSLSPGKGHHIPCRRS